MSEPTTAPEHPPAENEEAPEILTPTPASSELETSLTEEDPVVRGEAATAMATIAMATLGIVSPGIVGSRILELIPGLIPAMRTASATTALNATTNTANTVAATTANATAAVQTSSRLLQLPGEIRNRIYYHLVQQEKPHSYIPFQDLHAFACTSHMVRAEFWSYVLRIVELSVDLRRAANFIEIFYPKEPVLTEAPFGNVIFMVKMLRPVYVETVSEPTQLETLDILPLVCFLRKNTAIRFNLDKQYYWHCRWRDLRAFFDYIRVSPAWAVAPQLVSLRLRMREVQMVPEMEFRTFWIMDVVLDRNLQWLYETVGLLSWLEERKHGGQNGITFSVKWEKHEDEKSKKLKLRNGVQQVKRGLSKCRALVKRPTP